MTDAPHLRVSSSMSPSAETRLLVGMAEDDGGWDAAAAPPLLLPLFVVVVVGVPVVAAMLAETGCRTKTHSQACPPVISCTLLHLPAPVVVTYTNCPANEGDSQTPGSARALSHKM